MFEQVVRYVSNWASLLALSWPENPTRKREKTLFSAQLFLFLWLSEIFSHYVKNSCAHWRFAEAIFHKKELRNQHLVSMWDM